MATQPETRIVVIDDDDAHLDVVTTYLERAGYATTGFARPRDALYHLIDHPAALVVTDLYMPDMDGIELVRRLQASVPDIPVIGMTGQRGPQPSLFLRALREFGAVSCLHKPFDRDALLRAVHAVLG